MVINKEFCSMNNFCRAILFNAQKFRLFCGGGWWVVVVAYRILLSAPVPFWVYLGLFGLDWVGIGSGGIGDSGVGD